MSLDKSEHKLNITHIRQATLHWKSCFPWRHFVHTSTRPDTIVGFENTKNGARNQQGCAGRQAHAALLVSCIIIITGPKWFSCCQVCTSRHRMTPQSSTTSSFSNSSVSSSLIFWENRNSETSRGTSRRGNAALISLNQSIISATAFKYANLS